MYPAEYNILQIASKSPNTYNIVLFDKFNEEQGSLNKLLGPEVLQGNMIVSYEGVDHFIK